MRILSLLCWLSLSLVGNLCAEVFVEDWTDAINREVYKGELAVQTTTSVADILTPSEVVGICPMAEAPAKIIALQQQSRELQLPATLIVILDSGDKLGGLAPIQMQARNARVNFALAQTLIASAPTGYQQATKKASTKSASKTASETTTSDDAKMSYWLNTKTGVRHNQNCRYYGKGKNGRPCTKDEGRPCKICGG